VLVGRDVVVVAGASRCDVLLDDVTLPDDADLRQHLVRDFACREDAGWGERFLVIDDGGSCYFDVRYDLDAGAYT
jgi:hypothetical protein